jgi:hypothetical protein
VRSRPNHNHEEVETRAGDNLFVDFPWRSVVLSPYNPKESHPTVFGVCRERVDRLEQLEDPKYYFSRKSMYPSHIASPLHTIHLSTDKDDP